MTQAELAQCPGALSDCSANLTVLNEGPMRLCSSYLPPQDPACRASGHDEQPLMLIAQA